MGRHALGAERVEDGQVVAVLSSGQGTAAVVDVVVAPWSLRQAEPVTSEVEHRLVELQRIEPRRGCDLVDRADERTTADADQQHAVELARPADGPVHHVRVAKLQLPADAHVLLGLDQVAGEDHPPDRALATTAETAPVSTCARMPPPKEPRGAERGRGGQSRDAGGQERPGAPVGARQQHPRRGAHDRTAAQPASSAPPRELNGPERGGERPGDRAHGSGGVDTARVAAGSLGSRHRRQRQRAHRGEHRRRRGERQQRPRERAGGRPGQQVGDPVEERGRRTRPRAASPRRRAASRRASAALAGGRRAGRLPYTRRPCRGAPQRSSSPRRSATSPSASRASAPRARLGDHQHRPADADNHDATSP